MVEEEFTYKDEVFTVKLDVHSGDVVKADHCEGMIGEMRYVFDVARISANCFSLMLEGRNLLIYTAETKQELFVYLEGRIIKLGKAGGDEKRFARDSLEFGVKDKISAPMPGKVVKILVNAGDKVAVGQPLVVVESMKMENELRSPADAIVKSIHFSAGDLVSPDQPIIKLEPVESKAELQGG